MRAIVILLAGGAMVVASARGAFARCDDAAAVAATRVAAEAACETAVTICAPTG